MIKSTTTKVKELRMLRLRQDRLLRGQVEHGPQLSIPTCIILLISSCLRKNRLIRLRPKWEPII
jgi:hypothetical protein